MLPVEKSVLEMDLEKKKPPHKPGFSGSLQVYVSQLGTLRLLPC